MPLTLEEMEREAYQRGDQRAVEILQIASDGCIGEETVEELEDRVFVAEDKTERISDLITGASWRTGRKAELINLIEGIISITNEG